MELVDALEAGAAGKSMDERNQLCLQAGLILHWLRNKLPTNAELGQVPTCLVIVDSVVDCCTC